MTASGPKDASMQASGQGRIPWWHFGSNFTWAASLFLTALGARLGFILSCGRALPYLDQWPADAIDLFEPYFSGRFSAATLFVPHNMHRIFFTKLYDLALLLLNGQWDGVLEMTCNTVLFCAGLAGLGWVLASLAGRKIWPVLWIGLALNLILPFAWENTLWGFQSQFYFLVIFSWLAIWLLNLNPPWSGRWFLGAFCLLAAVFTLASGFLAAVAIAVVTGLMAAKQPRFDWRRYLPTWLLCAVIFGVGVALKLSVPADHTTEARSAADFLQALGKALAWPWAILPWYAPFNLLPLLVLGWQRLRAKAPVKPVESVIFGLAIWVASQALAEAYARGKNGEAPAWRHMDVLSLLTIANLTAAFLLWTDCGKSVRFAVLLRVVLICWALGWLSGLYFLTSRVRSEYLPEAMTQRDAQLKVTRAFMATGNPQVFESQPDDNRPVPSVEADVWLLTNPYIRAILPACAREPLHLKPAPDNGDTFVRNGWLLTDADPPTETSWGSYSARQAASRGTFQSLPFGPGALPYLEIPVAGDLGGPGMSLELIEVNGGKVTEVRPSTPPGGHWVNVRVKAPAGEFKLVARDDSDTQWFAFKEPRELGRWSYWTGKLLSAWNYILVLGLGVFTLNLARVRR